jgi:malate permease and related proteins
VLTVLVLLLVGVALGQLRALPAGAGPVLDAVVIRIALPALILTVVPDITLAVDLAVPVVVAWGSVALVAGLVWAGSRATGLDPRTRATLLLVVPLANTSFLGFPAVEALLGTDHLPPAVIYDQLGSFLALAVYGSILVSRSGAAPVRPPGQVVRQVATFPPFLALVVAFVLLPVGGLPGPLAEVAEVAGGMVTPLAMLAVGLRLRLTGGPAWRPAVLASCLAVRMVVAPAVAYGATVLAGGSGPAWDASVLETAMPPMVVAAVLAADAGLDAELASRLVGVGVLVAMVTLPGWAALL